MCALSLVLTMLHGHVQTASCMVHVYVDMRVEKICWA